MKKTSSQSLAPTLTPTTSNNNNNNNNTNNYPQVGDFQIISRIGKGSFATVYKAINEREGKIVALKAIIKSKLTSKLQDNLESEIAILQSLEHVNIVRLYGISKSDRYIYLQLEYCGGGDLHRYLRKEGPLDTQTTAHFLNELAQGLHFLVDRSYIHRDLKPQNLLLTSRSSRAGLKIADFGFARHLEVAAMAETLCGSPLYMAPEILRFHKYDAKADLWSVGTILFEMLVGRPPFHGANPQELLRNIERSELRLPQEVSTTPDCIDLLRGLLRRNPTQRLSFHEFFTCEFLRDVVSPSSPSVHPQQQPQPPPLPSPTAMTTPQTLPSEKQEHPPSSSLSSSLSQTDIIRSEQQPQPDGTVQLEGFFSTASFDSTTKQQQQYPPHHHHQQQHQQQHHHQHHQSKQNHPTLHKKQYEPQVVVDEWEMVHVDDGQQPNRTNTTIKQQPDLDEDNEIDYNELLYETERALIFTQNILMRTITLAEIATTIINGSLFQNLMLTKEEEMKFKYLKLCTSSNQQSLSWGTLLSIESLRYLEYALQCAEFAYDAVLILENISSLEISSMIKQSQSLLNEVSETFVAHSQRTRVLLSTAQSQLNHHPLSISSSFSSSSSINIQEVMLELALGLFARRASGRESLLHLTSSNKQEQMIIECKNDYTNALIILELLILDKSYSYLNEYIILTKERLASI